MCDDHVLQYRYLYFTLTQFGLVPILRRHLFLLFHSEELLFPFGYCSSLGAWAFNFLHSLPPKLIGRPHLNP